MITQLLTVKARLRILEAELKHDDLLTRFIEWMGARFDRECNRTFARGEGITEEFAGDDTELRLSRYPVESVASFHLKETETSGWEAQSGVDYVIRRTCVISLPASLGTWRQQLRVTYTGGYVMPGDTAGDGQTELPDDVENAAIEQVAYLFQNRDRLGLVSVSGEGGAIQNFAQLDLLPSVKATLQPHRRLNL